MLTVGALLQFTDGLAVSAAAVTAGSHSGALLQFTDGLAVSVTGDSWFSQWELCCSLQTDWLCL